jgi:WD40 repeat protein
MDVRRRFAALRRPRLLAAALILLGTYLFATNLTPWPRYVVRTEAKLDQRQRGNAFWSKKFAAYWGGLGAVSNDGDQVTIGIHRGDRRFPSRWEVWDTRTGEERTPVHWRDPDWQKLWHDADLQEVFDPGPWPQPSRLADLAVDPSGNEVLHDAAAWASLRRRLAIARARHVDDLRQAGRLVGDEAADGSPFPDSLRFSRDGRFVSYVAQNGWPVYLGWLSTGDATVIEDSRTSRRVAMFSEVAGHVVVAPDGQSVVIGNLMRGLYGFPGGNVREVEQPPLILRDLETASRCAELSLTGSNFRHFEYSPDGRYVLAHSWPLIRWWDTATGRQVGEAGSAWDPQFLDSGRVLIVPLEDNQAIRLWDVPTGRELDEWELPNPPGQAGLFGRLLAAGGDRYLVAEFNDPDSKSARSFLLLDRVVDRLTDKLPDGPDADRSRVAVLDVIDRRVSRPVPGREAALSADGRWLATLDADGVVRVWPVPLGRPWVRGFVYAAAVVLGGWGLWRLVGRVRRRLWPRAE